MTVQFNAAALEVEMTDGYLDGWQDDREDLPPSLSNRSTSYRHGWLNGRDDRLGRARQTAAISRLQADAAIAHDLKGSAI